MIVIVKTQQHNSSRINLETQQEAIIISLIGKRCASPLPSTTAEDKKRQYKDEDQNSAGGASGDDSD
ncbi:hypothetical protein Bca52824_021798 [Brassica carinata]|uniref:Uncharacterized protein n=1 Tax=Brassica carinata TaxID=52824 RepID=A0A8X7VFH5_BRACI|nr:hypothetical protein Bca52824_021798 [Brassica carinata]